MSEKPPPRRPVVHPSGEHEAVKTFREKLESIAEHQVADVGALDRELDEYLESMRTTPPPPAPDSEPEKDPTP